MDKDNTSQIEKLILQNHIKYLKQIKILAGFIIITITLKVQKL